MTRGADGILRRSPRDASVVHQLQRTVADRPGVTAIVGGDGATLTYGQLWDRASRVAGGLRSGGVRPGDRAIIRMPNVPGWCVAFWGCLLAGVVPVPISTRLTAVEEDRIAEDCAPSARLADPATLPDGPPTVDLPEDEDALAALFYTSGTTGRPKGARTTHANLVANVDHACTVLGLRADDPPRTLVVAPLYHVTGCHSQLLPSCRVGGVTILSDGTRPATVRELIQDAGVTAMMGAPAMYSILLRSGPLPRPVSERIRSLTFGGAPVPAEAVARLREAFPQARLGIGYGLTEASSFVTYLADEDVNVVPGTVGSAVPMVDVRAGRPDEPGEVLVRGPNVVDGYWRNALVNAITFRDGWLRTGDLGHLDQAGRLTIVDRIKDVINRAGDNVFSLEVERAITAHPAVREACVVGMPDHLVGERVAAAIVLDDPAAELRDILRTARESLAAYKMPDLVAVVPNALPRNTAGKVLRDVLRAQAPWRTAPRPRRTTG